MVKKNKKVVFIVAYEGYEPTEYGTPKKLLQKEGYEVVTASTQPGQALAKDGSTTKVDVLVKDIQPTEYDGLFVIGGPGVPDFLYDDQVYEAVQRFNMAEKPIGAICHGVRVLAQAGALVSRKATGWDGDGKLKGILDEHGAIYIKVPYLIDEMDKRVLTAQGPAQAADFARGIMKIV